MLVTKTRHEREVKLLNDQLQMMQYGYESRIQALQEQIADLRQFVFSPTRANDIPAAHYEADQIMTQNEPKLPTEEELQETEDAMRERDRLFSGNYDEVIV